ncbi:MAG: hypothetical protein Q7R47_03745 [Candidatus Diapherotrites archaeon]|nr:hypothetical protein [Candidatus Diapherotrites archaeon]
MDLCQKGLNRMQQKQYRLVFDPVMLHQLKKLGKDKSLQALLTKMRDKIEERGPLAGKLIDSILSLFEVKTRAAKQQRVIQRIREKAASEA